MSEFIIRVDNDDLIFNASHFITFEDGTCEALHGHNYCVAVEVRGLLNSSQYVIDFVVLHDIVKNLLKELDHRILLPRNHPRIAIRTMDNELEVVLGERRWVLPNDDCTLLPVTNTTSEMLAQYLAGLISEEFFARKIASLRQIRVEIRESRGFTAIYQHSSDE